ncbi:MAG TPA: hypothetical protein P5140_08540 [Methanofastidiosum sp.]|nr:hypothetical protein [Methanofastidiosum sp.]
MRIIEHEMKKFLHLMDECLPMCEKGRRTGSPQNICTWISSPELDCNGNWSGSISILEMKWKWGKVTKDRVTIRIFHPDGQEESLRLTIDDWMSIYKMILDALDSPLEMRNPIKTDGFRIKFDNNIVEIKKRKS